MFPNIQSVYAILDFNAKTHKNKDMKRRIQLAVVMLLSITGIAKAQDAPAAYITFSEAVIPQGGIGEMEVYYQTNENSKFKAFQIDVPLPEGITIENLEMKLRPEGIDEGAFSRINESDYEPSNKFFTIVNNGNDKSVAMGFQMGDVAFPTNEKTHLCTLTLKAAETTAINRDGYTALTSRIELTSEDIKVMLSQDQTLNIKVLKRGDVNADGEVDIADAVCVINHIHNKPNDLFYKSVANANQDEDIDIADVVSIINIIHHITPSQQAPRAEELLLDPQ